MSSLLLKNGTVIDYQERRQEQLDIWIEDGQITKMEEEILDEADVCLDCRGLFLVPGMIDMHCHVREPGFEYKETIETGARSAVKGGFTTICPMPNTNPTTDTTSGLLFVQEKAKQLASCHVFPYASVTKGQKGEELVEFEELAEYGAIGFSDDGIPVKNALVMRQAMLEANKVGKLISSHCEQIELAKGAITEGEVSQRLDVKGILPEAEEVMVAREIVLSETNHIPIHICHVSTKTSVNLIRDAKKRGVLVTCETCPHYFSLTEQEILHSGTNAKMNPPLRKEEDRQAIIKGLQDGTIDVIVTDHAPHSKEEKQQDLETAPNGIIGFETALAVIITYLIKPKLISWFDFVKLTSYQPAKRLQLFKKGELKVGFDADITIIDPEYKGIYQEESIVSKSKNTPYIGKTLIGQVAYTIVDGKVKYKR